MRELRKEGFSLWCDFIQRDFLNTTFKVLIKNGIIYGATSNPSIFANAILKSHLYKNDINRLKGSMDSKSIYENLAFNDIANAAESLMPLYLHNKDDGFISIEIDPLLSNDARGSIEEGKRIYKTINKENVMIKVPATNEGYEVINELTKANINVNATLIFSTTQVIKCLESVYKNTKSRVVISIFVSRFDRYLEDIYKDKNPTPKLGVYNAMKCAKLINEFNSTNIRALFASTGVKGDFINPNYYIESLLLKNTINTAPLESIEQFIKNGDKKLKNIESNLDFYLVQYDIEDICKKLFENGINAFVKSFEEMLRAI
ncbi:transaldolase [Helicobacter sp. MIT 14-3879]|uniref:transaldolase n=1 Tax=Helicobacter sp. MIT 14-3879 TaxID=2040649 RepID=UPI000E1EE984|nr:transaldolase [Helicobacter sp. MIT 14-3879]RDU65606.1 transaldolase [Helicobacter sp. MIT 14-3879]